eukprot:g6795.t1
MNLIEGWVTTAVLMNVVTAVAADTAIRPEFLARIKAMFAPEENLDAAASAARAFFSPRLRGRQPLFRPRHGFRTATGEQAACVLQEAAEMMRFSVCGADQSWRNLVNSEQSEPHSVARATSKVRLAPSAVWYKLAISRVEACCDASSARHASHQPSVFETQQCHKVVHEPLARLYQLHAQIMKCARRGALARGRFYEDDYAACAFLVPGEIASQTFLMDAAATLYARGHRVDGTPASTAFLRTCSASPVPWAAPAADADALAKLMREHRPETRYEYHLGERCLKLVRAHDDCAGEEAVERRYAPWVDAASQQDQFLAQIKAASTKANERADDWMRESSVLAMPARAPSRDGASAMPVLARVPPRGLVVACYVVTAAQYSLMSLVAPFFPQRAEEDWGWSSGLVGLVVACDPLGEIIAAFFSTYVIALIGARRAALLGMGLNAASSLLFGFAPQLLAPGASGASTGGLATLLVLTRLANGFATCVTYVAIFQLLGAAFPDAVGKISGDLSALSTLGLIAGPPVGGALYAAGAHCALGSFATPFVGFAVLLLLVPLPLAARHLPRGSLKAGPTAGRGRERTEPSLADEWRFSWALLDAEVAWCLVAVFVAMVVSDGIAPALGPHLAGPPFSLSPPMVALVFVAGCA